MMKENEILSVVFSEEFIPILEEFKRLIKKDPRIPKDTTIIKNPEKLVSHAIRMLITKYVLQHESKLNIVAE